jgi:hypothetical protein
MKSQIGYACIALIIGQTIVSGFSTQDKDEKKKTAAFSLADTKYFHRFTKDCTF